MACLWIIQIKSVKIFVMSRELALSDNRKHTLLHLLCVSINIAGCNWHFLRIIEEVKLETTRFHSPDHRAGCSGYNSCRVNSSRPNPEVLSVHSRALPFTQNPGAYYKDAWEDCIGEHIRQASPLARQFRRGYGIHAAPSNTLNLSSFHSMDTSEHDLITAALPAIKDQMWGVSDARLKRDRHRKCIVNVRRVYFLLFTFLFS